jgi:hypothetical protein
MAERDADGAGSGQGGATQRAPIFLQVGLVLEGRPQRRHTDGQDRPTPGPDMRDTDLLQLALGLVPPWMVKAANLDAEARRLDIEIDFTKGGRFPCPHCAKTDTGQGHTYSETPRLSLCKREACLTE